MASSDFLMLWLMRTKKKRVVILENIIGDLLQKTSDLVYWKQVMKVLFLFKSNTKIIITTYCVNREPFYKGRWKLCEVSHSHSNIICVATEKGTHQRKTDHSVTFTTLSYVIFNIFYVENIRKSEEAIVYLDENESLTYEDKISILKSHSQKHNIEDIEDYIAECCKWL
jgi:hypothetical protein